ncbi:MAG TPA: putative glycolipid-binding domain-containing protein [Thermoplasmataceae archaeon]|nr:putative glycolipid-binding domain-containing protein [Thermoplasmatales archaeon AK]HLH86740.1 putative glycolipid-binding domain-containing protein [Thermoplasmataceae archaeon]
MIRRAVWEHREQKLSESCLINTEYGISGKGYIVCTYKNAPFGMRYEFLSDFSLQRLIFRAELHKEDRSARLFLGMTDGSLYGHIDGKPVEGIKGLDSIDLSSSLFPKFIIARKFSTEQTERRSFGVLHIDLPSLKIGRLTLEVSRLDRHRYLLEKSDQSGGKILETSSHGIPLSLDGWLSADFQ